MELCVLLAAVLQQQPAKDTPSEERVRSLIEDLRSDSVEKRITATERLIQFDRAILLYLEKSAKHPDAEVRGRVSDVIREIERRVRVRAFGPAREPVSLRLEGVPLAEAADRVFSRFGISNVRWASPPNERTVDLRLKKASLWEAYESFCATTGYHPKQLAGAMTWRFQEAGNNERAYAHQDFGNVRLVARESGARKTGDGPWKNSVALWALLPPKAHASSWRIEHVEVTDENGRVIKAEGEAETPGDRQPGIVTSAKLWTAVILPKDLEGVESLTLKGRLLLRFPHDFESHEVDLAKVAPPFKVRIRDAVIGITKLGFIEDRAWSLSFNARNNGEALSFLVWTEDKRGRWLFDAASFRLDADGNLGYTQNSRGPKIIPPHRLVLSVIKRERDVRMDFLLKGFPPPAPPPEK